jgi:hypothetical protein
VQQLKNSEFKKYQTVYILTIYRTVLVPHSSHIYICSQIPYFALPGFLLLLGAPAFFAGVRAVTTFHTGFLASAASHSVAGVSAHADFPVAGIQSSLMSLIVLG